MRRTLSASKAAGKLRKQIYCKHKTSKANWHLLLRVLQTQSCVGLRTVKLPVWWPEKKKKETTSFHPAGSHITGSRLQLGIDILSVQGEKINWQISPLMIIIIINIPMNRAQICSSHCANFHFMHNSPVCPKPSLFSLPPFPSCTGLPLI